MRDSTQVKSISFLKAKSAEVLERLAENRRPLIITRNGEAKAVLQDVASYERRQINEVVLWLACIIGRRMAREDFAALITANDNAPQSDDEQEPS